MSMTSLSLIMQLIFLKMNRESVFKIIRICWVGLLELCGKAVDVWSNKSYLANVLSNLYPNAYKIDGVK